MCELNTDFAILSMDKVDSALDARDVFVLPDAQIAGSDSATVFNSGGLGNDQSCTVDGVAAEVDKVEVGHVATLGRVHAHGGDNNTVGEVQILDGEWLEEQRDLVFGVLFLVLCRLLELADVGAWGDWLGRVVVLLGVLGQDTVLHVILKCWHCRW